MHLVPMEDEGISELEALLKVSDKALYRAKDSGRNGVEIALAHSRRSGLVLYRCFLSIVYI